MKKLLAVLLAAFMILSMASCGKKSGNTEGTGASDAAGNSESAKGSEDNPGTGKFSVGYGIADITPQESVPLAGYGNTEKRLSTGMLTYLYTTCTVFTDADGESIAIFANDLVDSKTALFPEWRNKISEATGIPADHIFFTGSHTHSGPDLSQTGFATIANYKEMLVQQFKAAAEAALSDRSEAKFFVARTRMENMNFIRHSILASGEKTGYAPGSGETVVGYAGYKDNELQLLKIKRSDSDPSKKDIIISNWQCHPHRSGSQQNTDVSADIVFYYRKTLEDKLGVYAQYVTGAAGNTNPKSYIEADNITKEFKEQGIAMAQHAIDCEDAYEEIQTGKIKVKEFTYDLLYDHSMDDLLPAARDVQKFWTESNDVSETKKYGAPFGINSPYHANKIVGMSSKGKSNPVVLSAVSIGDFAFATFPGEMFAKGGMMVKEASPYKLTFFIGYCDGSNGYFPTEDAYEYVGYETDTTLYVKGSAEAIATFLGEQLNELYKEE